MSHDHPATDDAVAALTQLPQIGPVTARQLVAVGVSTPEALRAVGAKQAFLKIRDQLDPGACVQLLYGLQAAVLGLAARELTAQTKAELRAWKAGV
ncbi:MAG: TfoX/Sxy family protein [Propionibacteriaceae bacterium]|jgi:DNA transformation protein|nr:TfoX/Sxy family protein [Propionibacteriaceae bacterium]